MLDERQKGNILKRIPNLAELDSMQKNEIISYSLSAISYFGSKKIPSE